MKYNQFKLYIEYVKKQYVEYIYLYIFIIVKGLCGTSLLSGSIKTHNFGERVLNILKLIFCKLYNIIFYR